MYAIFGKVQIYKKVCQNYNIFNIDYNLYFSRASFKNFAKQCTDN